MKNHSFSYVLIFFKGQTEQFWTLRNIFEVMIVYSYKQIFKGLLELQLGILGYKHSKDLHSWIFSNIYKKQITFNCAFSRIIFFKDRLSISIFKEYFKKYYQNNNIHFIRNKFVRQSNFPFSSKISLYFEKTILSDFYCCILGFLMIFFKGLSRLYIF